jgi:hypothetical protein
MWVLVDPDVPAEVQSTWIAAHGGPLEPATYGTIDLRAGEAYVLGGDAWQRCRTSGAALRQFHGAGKGEGMPGVSQALLQDLDGLNKVELTTHDWWGGDLDDKSPEELTLEDLATHSIGQPSSRCTSTPTSTSCGSSTRNSHTVNWYWPGYAAMRSTTNVPCAAGQGSPPLMLGCSRIRVNSRTNCLPCPLSGSGRLSLDVCLQFLEVAGLCQTSPR